MSFLRTELFVGAAVVCLLFVLLGDVARAAAVAAAVAAADVAAAVAVVCYRCCWLGSPWIVMYIILFSMSNNSYDERLSSFAAAGLETLRL
ncbi:MAG: hypothetical protein VXZ27_09150 [SAR324 cluster bacterium]|nr:hypothetical protein [SAR324 cluster bacterium]